MHPTNPDSPECRDGVPSPAIAAPTSVDVILDGAVRLEQRRTGYRFGVDAVLLTAFAHPLMGTDILDVGAGSGPIGLGLAHLHPQREVHLIERQHGLARLARANIARNHLGARCRVSEIDVRRLTGARYHHDGAVINPPYYPAHAGLHSPDDERACARHLRFGDLEALLRATVRHLYERSWLCVVYPAHNLGALLHALDGCGRRSVIVQSVLPRAGKAAHLVLVAARASSTHTMQMLPPLVLHADAREYTETAQEILRTGHWSWQK